MELEIHVDRTRCIGSGQCVHLAPGVFDQDDRALAVVTDPRGEPEEKIAHAVTACPMRAISLRLDGTTVAATDLQDWVRGARSDDPLVAVLERLAEEHHELRQVLSGLPSPPSSRAVEAARTATRSHLRSEDEVYARIVALVDHRVVDAFERDHAHIERALGDLAEIPPDPVRRGRALAELATAVDDHIRLEETILFPLVLAAIARRASADAVTTA